jgi:hypothetical protein
MTVPPTTASPFAGLGGDEVRRTVLLAALAVVAAGALLLAIQAARNRELFAEIDSWRSIDRNKYAQFLEWMRLNEEG